jgi:uncharacterized protein
MVILLIVPVAVDSQEIQIPQLERYATDLTGTLSSFELERLEEKLRTFDSQTSTQIVVLMVATTGDLTIEDAALQTAERNAIGRQGKDNGALLFIAKQDRALRIEVGYGLEGSLTDAVASTIIRRVVIPHFKEGNYYAGIDAGVDAMILATRDEFNAEGFETDDARPGFITLVIMLFVFLSLISVLVRGRRGMVGVPGPFTSSGRRSWGGGGFGGGGFSGGGGSFGGGGASGRW